MVTEERLLCIISPRFYCRNGRFLATHAVAVEFSHGSSSSMFGDTFTRQSKVSVSTADIHKDQLSPLISLSFVTASYMGQSSPT